MDCHDVRDQLLDFQQGRLAPDLVMGVRRHLDHCGDCAHADLVERELTQVLERRTPQYSAPVALKRKLAANWPAQAPAAPRRRGGAWLRLSLPAALAAAVLLLLAPSVRELLTPKSEGGQVMVGEAVNDHVRMLQSQRPLEVESSGLHQVIPWFSGKLDFAPRIRFAGDEEFPLRGGAVGYFSYCEYLEHAEDLDRATQMIRHRVEHLRGAVGVAGFDGVDELPAHLREGELGYALVSDVNAADLLLLASKLSPSA